MITINQLLNKARKPKIKRIKRPALAKNPQLKGICLKVMTVKPKKPNSAIRKIAKVKLSNGYNVISYIPGQGHTLQQHSVVLIRGGRRRDLPGVQYQLIRGKLDFNWKESFSRKKRRSKFGIPLNS